MTELFVRILNISISASWLIPVVLLLRFFLKKAPKWVNVLLWGIVAIRLVSLVSIESTLSLIPSAEVVSPSVLIETPKVTTGFPAVDDAINPVIEESRIETAPEKSGSTLKVVLRICSRVWATGVAILLAYTVISYWRLKRRVNVAVQYRDNIFQNENVSSPFVLGIFQPRIYLPFHISEQSMIHVLAHEQAHIQRKDHWWKPFGFLLLTIHWFNPLMWLAYVLLCRDIELACDEKVIKELGTEARADYSAALLSCSVSRHSIAACPVAFGEVSVKMRVKSVLSYNKPAFWVILIALVLCAVFAVCFLTNPIGNDREPDLSFLNYENAISVVADREDVQVIYYPAPEDQAESFIKLGIASGNELARYLDNCRWSEVDAPMDSLSSPGSIEFVIKDDYRITVYERKEWSFRQYASVSYEDSERYYRIDSGDYEGAVDLLITQENEGCDDFEFSAESGKYYHTITQDNVAQIEIKTPYSSGGCAPADGSVFARGEKVCLEPLDGMQNLNGVTISALDENGVVLYAVSLPMDETQRKNLQAQLIAIQDGYYLVEALDSQPQLSKSDKFLVPIMHLDPSLEPEVGDLILIEYGAVDLSVYPGEILDVYSISVSREVDYGNSEMTEIVGTFFMNFAGNSTVGNHFELTQDGFWRMTVVNEGKDRISIEVGGEVWFAEAGKTTVIQPEVKWEEGLYSASFSTHGRSGMHGSVLCEVSATDFEHEKKITEHDLRNGDITLSKNELDRYVFFTNSEQISVVVSSEDSFVGEIILQDYTNENTQILFARVNDQDDAAIFTNLTSSKLYSLACVGLEDCTFHISGDHYLIAKHR